MTHICFNSNAAQAICTTSYLRLLILTLPSLPHVLSKTICRALKRTWLDKWPRLNINLSHSLIYRVIFQPYQPLIQMTTWALVWGRCEVGEEAHQVPVNAVGIVNGLNKLWKCTKPSALLLCPGLSNMDLFLSTLQKRYVFNLILQSVSWCCSWRDWDGTACGTVFERSGRILNVGAATGKETHKDLTPMGQCGDLWWDEDGKAEWGMARK